MESALNVTEAAKRLSPNQKSILRSLFQFKSPVPTQFYSSDKNVILKLQDRDLVEIQNGQVLLTITGKEVIKY
jgi:predicted methyltransferase